MKPRLALLTGALLGSILCLCMAQLDPEMLYERMVAISGTNFVNEVVVTNGITLGGVRNTAWPGAGSQSPWTSDINANTHALTNYTSLSDVNGNSPQAGSGALTNLASGDGSSLGHLQILDRSFLSSSTNYLPSFSSMNWLPGPYINDGGAESWTAQINSPSVRATGSNTFILNSEANADNAFPYLFMFFSAPQYGSSNCTFTVPFAGVSTNASLRIAAYAGDNPLSATFTTFSSTNSAWTNATVSWSSSNTVRLVVTTSGGKSVYLSNAWVTLGTDYTNNSLFTNPYKRWDVDQFNTLNNGFGLMSPSSLNGYSMFSRVEFDTSATNVVLEFIQDQGSFGTGDITVFTNGVFCVEQKFPSKQTAQVGTLYMVNLPALPPGENHVTVYNGYVETQSFGHYGDGIYCRGIYTESNAFLSFQRPTQETLLCFGDSITGQATDSTAWAADWWGTQFERKTGIKVTAISIGGGTIVADSTNEPSLLMAVRKTKPSYVMVQYGENDYASGLTVPLYTNYYARIVDAVHLAAPQAMIYCMVPIPQTSEVAVNGYTLGDYRAGITNVVAGRWWYCQTIDGTTLPNTATYKNGLHLTAAGNMLYVNLIYRALRSGLPTQPMPFDSSGNLLPPSPRPMAFPQGINADTGVFTNGLQLPNLTVSTPVFTDGSGKLSSSGSISSSFLPNVGTAGTYGDATHFPVITTDAQGRVTSVATNSAGGTSFANPTANVSNTAVNGSASTAMRSDAAPPISTSATLQFGHLGLGVAPDATHILEIGAGTVTADTHILDATETWNSSGVTFTGIKLSITDTASASGSLLLNLLTGASGTTSVFSIRKDGYTTANVGVGTPAFFTTSGGQIANMGTVSGIANGFDVINVLRTKAFISGLLTKTTNYTAAMTDHTILLNGTTLTLTLPTAASVSGQEYIIKLIANSTATVATTSSQNIDAATTYSLSAQYKYVKVQSDGTQWWIIANN